MTHILHIIHELSGGGAAREMLNLARVLDRSRGYVHKIIALKPAGEHGRQLAVQTGVEVVECPSPTALYAEMEQADIVQIEWWNCSLVTSLLHRPFPDCRLVIRYHVAGDKAPHIVTANHLKLADLNILSKADNPILEAFDADWKEDRVSCILHGSDFSRMPNVEPRPHAGFNVGYIGTVNFVKMHPDYIEMSHRIDIPDVRFVVCGSVSEPSLLEDVRRLRAEHKFQFMGYLERLDDVIAEMDVFGYPLCPDTYASTELVLQEVMYARIPPVVFPYGGVEQTVLHNVNGYVVRNEDEYVRAIEYLYRHPRERKRLGDAARRYVVENLGIENTSRQYERVYERLLTEEKKPHRWGNDYHRYAEDQPVLDSNLPGCTGALAPAQMFVESLGPEVGRVFSTSLAGLSTDEVLRAENGIKRSRYLLAKNGVIPFRNLYPHDPHLNLWAGLCCEGLQDYTAAAVCYSTAVNNGLTDWRVYWYLARTLERLGEHAQGGAILENLQTAVPGFKRWVSEYSINT